MMPSTRKTKRGDDGTSATSTSPTTKRNTKKAKAAGSPANDLAVMRSQHQQLIQEREDMEKRHGEERGAFRSEQMEEISQYTCAHTHGESEISDKYRRMYQELFKRHEKEWDQWEEKMKEKRQPELLSHREKNTTIQAFCQFQGGGILTKISDCLDPISLFNLGRAMFVAVYPLTHKSAPLLEALKSNLLKRTANPGMEVDNKNLFQSPMHSTIYETKHGKSGIFFHHSAPRANSTKKPCDFYESLGSIEQEAWGRQGIRKAAAMKDISYSFNGMSSAYYNEVFYGAYNFAGYGWKEDAFQGNCTDKVMKEIGAYAANARFPKWWTEIVFCAMELAIQGDRNYVLLQDMLEAAERMNIRFYFPIEKMHTISLLHGHTISATITELASFESNFKDVNEEAGEAEEGYATWAMELARIDATNKAQGDDPDSLEMLKSKAKATIEDHIALEREWLDEMKELVEREQCPFDCDDDVEITDSDVENQMLEWLLEETSVSGDLIDKEVEARQTTATQGLNAFTQNVIPFLQEEVRPQLVGNSLMFLEACQEMMYRFQGVERLHLSISASLFFQQLFEDISLGTALQPILWRAPLKTVSAEEEPVRRRSKCLAAKSESTTNNPPSFFIHLVLCPNGTTIVSKHKHINDLYDDSQARRDELQALEHVEKDEDDSDDDFTESDEATDDDDNGIDICS